MMWIRSGVHLSVNNLPDVIHVLHFSAHPLNKQFHVFLSFCPDTARNPEFMEMHSGTTDPPLCLMIGYTDGMQIWGVSVSH